MHGVTMKIIVAIYVFVCLRNKKRPPCFARVYFGACMCLLSFFSLN